MTPNLRLVPWRALRFALAVFALCAVMAVLARAQGLGEQVDTTVRETGQALKDAGQSAADKLAELWLRLDESRLKNRTRDEIVAWLLMGCLVGSLTVTLGLFRSTAGGRARAVALGLVGAFIGGVIVHVGGVDFGLGPVLIRYEDLVFAVAGSAVLLGVSQFLTRRRTETKPDRR